MFGKYRIYSCRPDKKMNTWSSDEIKSQLIKDYMFLMSAILLFYFIAFWMAAINDFIIIITGLGAAALGILRYVLRHSETKHLLSCVRLYLAIAPFYNLLFIVILHQASIGNIIWFLPLPLGAYVLYSRKSSFRYYLYSGAIVVLGIFLSLLIDRIYEPLNRDFRVFMDFAETTAFFFNGFLIVVLIFYNDKIKEADAKASLGATEKKINTRILNDECGADYIKFFRMMDEKIRKEKKFTDPNLNISRICIDFQSNASQVSRAIRSQGYSNFSSYINHLRLEYVKELLDIQDLEKVTLFSIYSDAGFANQPTFNRVFKQFEGVTPTEYIKNKYDDLSGEHLMHNEA